MLKENIHNIIKNINDLSINNESLDGIISKYSINLISDKKELPDISLLDSELFIFKSTISRYTKKIGFKSYKNLAFIIKNIKLKREEHNKKEENKNISNVFSFCETSFINTKVSIY